MISKNRTPGKRLLALPSQMGGFHTSMLLIGQWTERREIENLLLESNGEKSQVPFIS